MARPRIAPTVLASKGRPLALLNPATGQTHNVVVCFGMASLLEVEERFGSIQGAMEVLNAASDGKAFTQILRLLSCGLLHEVDDNGRPFSDVEALAEFADPSQIGHYGEVLGEALSAAFPDAGNDEGSKGDEAGKDSPLTTGGTSPESASASPTPSSGP